MTSSIQGPGLLHVRSRISPSAASILSESTYLKWYDDEHITEVVSTSGINSGFRYIDINKTSVCGDAANPKPFLAFYPMEKLEFTLGDEFRKIGFQSENLPGTGIVYDLADLDVSYLGLEGVTRRKKEGKGSAKFILSIGLRPSSNIGLASFLERQISHLEKTPSYVRTLTFQLQYARTNAQSRALKGLPTTDEPSPEPSMWLALHEFEEKPGSSDVNTLRKDLQDLEGEVGTTLESEVYVWGLKRVHGKGELFD
ncbi:hypothetical protein FB567DRAFT_92489 [Paraphoma chrysanthemicola]|uniref:Uncharacterized protein n=1 Tax=Paraphoma chrysanthemicola TaxID=798071 RepID=A0A8K0R4N0_9PLEO|nr:hypothetical protein FB567DRAFT_92489 [Paraphoma chrysanthemicola]